jgi:hypothetical protein
MDKEEIVDYSKNYCFNCHKNKGEDKFNIKCESCNIIICDDCIEGDLLNGVKCIHCSRYAQKIENGGCISDSNSDSDSDYEYPEYNGETLKGAKAYDSDDHFYLDNINEV